MDLGLDTQTLSRISLRYQENPDLALMEAVRQLFKKADYPRLLMIDEYRRNQGKGIVYSYRITKFGDLANFYPAKIKATQLTYVIAIAAMSERQN